MHHDALLASLVVAPVRADAQRSAVPARSSPPDVEVGTVPPVFDLAWGTLGTSAGQFNYATGVAVAPSGDVYVADRANHRIQEFTATGTFVRTWGADGTDPGQFHNPTDVAVDAVGNVYVTDEGNHRIQKFTAAGTFVTQWGSIGDADGSFVYPSGLVVTEGGEVYVTDSANHRVQRFTNTGTFLGKWGTTGFADGEFNYPGGIAEGANGEILVADGNDRVQRFSPTGTFLGKWTGFSDPVSVDVDSEGDVYVSDQAGHRIRVYTPTGTPLLDWGGYGSDPGQFNYPHGVAIGAGDSVYVVDHFNHRVQRFVPPEPSLSVTKTAEQSSVLVGQDIEYRVTVTNTGNQALTGLTVSDPNAPGCSGGLGDLPVGADPVPVECTYTPSDEDVGTYTNVATVDSDQTEPVASDSVDVTVEAAPAPSLSVTKTADQTAVIVGEAIDYRVTVTNTGDVPLTAVTVSDPNAPDCDGAVTDLAVGSDPVVVGCSYTPNEADVGTYTNVATVDTDETEPVASNPVDVTVGSLRPDAKIRRGTGKTVGNDVYNTTGVDQTRNASVLAGGTATFTVKFQNDGTVDDDLLVRGPASTTRFRVTYLFGGVDVTDRVTAGTFRLEGVPAGSSYALTVKVKAKAGTPRGAVFTAKVKVTSAFDATKKDVVKAVVTRV